MATPACWLFEYACSSTIIEQALKSEFKQSHCFGGIAGANRDEISSEIYRDFKITTNWKQLSANEQQLFDDYFKNIFSAKLNHPTRKVSFHYGDTLEPKFLRDIGRADLEPVIEKALTVKF